MDIPKKRASHQHGFTATESLTMLAVLFVFTWLLLGIMRKEGLLPFLKPAAKRLTTTPAPVPSNE